MGEQHIKKIHKIVCISLVFFVFAFLTIRFLSVPHTVQQTESAKTVRDPLTGVLVSSVEPLPQVFGVMIDEHVDARPQSGIDQAFLVMEAPVEAGIPRLLAFFTDKQEVKQIGPIRSARPYFIDWISEFGAVYAHVGGSDEALEKIKATNTFDANEYWNGTYYWRSSDRFAPHNTYTSTDLLKSFVEKKSETSSRDSLSYGVWPFQDGSANNVEQSFDVSYVQSGYVFSWHYNKTANMYDRFEGNVAAKTLDGVLVSANNVAVVVMDVDVIDQVGRRHIKTIGEGQGVLFQNGVQKKMVWKKNSPKDRMRFYDENGSEVLMNAGKTWVEVVSDLSKLRVH